MEKSPSCGCGCLATLGLVLPGALAAAIEAALEFADQAAMVAWEGA
jgi:hypothetical protein